MKTNDGVEGKETANGKKTLIQWYVAAFLVLVIVLLWKAAEVFLLIFAGVLLAVFFRALSTWTSEKTHLSERWSLAVVLLTLTSGIAGGVWAIAPGLSAQVVQLADRIPRAVDQARQHIQSYEWFGDFLGHEDQLSQMAPDGSKVVSSVAQFFTTTFGALGNFVIFLAIGIFLAISPDTYFKGLVRLVPPESRTRATEVLHSIGTALRAWLLAKIVAMLAVGVLTAAGLWLIGIELALSLAILAALLTFIPNIGPILALVPAALLAMMHGPDKLIYVVSLYMGIQALESYVLTPLLQQQMVDLPPALIISMQILLGVLVGGLGIILATPLTAALLVLVKMVYIEDILQDPGS